MQYFNCHITVSACRSISSMVVKTVRGQRTKLLWSCLKHIGRASSVPRVQHKRSKPLWHWPSPSGPLACASQVKNKSFHSWLSSELDRFHSQPERAHPGTESALDGWNCVGGYCRLGPISMGAQPAVRAPPPPRHSKVLCARLVSSAVPLSSETYSNKHT